MLDLIILVLHLLSKMYVTEITTTIYINLCLASKNILKNTFLSLKANSSLSDALNSLEIDSDGKFLFALQ